MGAVANSSSQSSGAGGTLLTELLTKQPNDQLTKPNNELHKLHVPRLQSRLGAKASKNGSCSELLTLN